MRIELDDPTYPERLRRLPDPPSGVTLSGPLEPAPSRAVAIVGSRAPHPDALAFARELAFDLASAGVTIVSGGALGIDGAAHRGAMDADGATWVVAPTGRDRVFPPEHEALFDEVARSERSRMIWPFPEARACSKLTLRRRNGVLVALSDAVVVVQAYLKSGSRNAAGWARDLGRALWIVPPAPWMASFEGCRVEIAHGGRPLWRAADLFDSLGLPAPGSDEPAGEAPPSRGTALEFALEPPPPRRRRKRRPIAPDASWSCEERVVFSTVSATPTHLETIASTAGLGVSSAVTALLTLALKDVVVEGPDGFFRRKQAR